MHEEPDLDGWSWRIQAGLLVTVVQAVISPSAQQASQSVLPNLMFRLGSDGVAGLEGHCKSLGSNTIYCYSQS
jgi:hypothetical protein